MQCKNHFLFMQITAAFCFIRCHTKTFVCTPVQVNLLLNTQTLIQVIIWISVELGFTLFGGEEDSVTTVAQRIYRNRELSTIITNL